MNNISFNSLVNGIKSDYININDRSIHYGDGLFETVLCNDNKLYYWPQHFQRLQKSADRLKLACPDEQVLLDDVSKLLEGNIHLTSCAIKIIISRSAGERGYKYSDKVTSNRFVLLSVIEEDYSSLLSAELQSGDLYLCEQQVSINESLAGLKHLNRLENVMASNEWRAGYIDGLMLNANQHVIEGTMSNLFAVRDKEIFTPELKLSGVNGVMREMIIDIADKSNIKTSIKNLTVDDLKKMDELFISNSLLGMKSVRNFCDTMYSEKQLTTIIFGELLKTKENHAQVV